MGIIDIFKFFGVTDTIRALSLSFICLFFCCFACVLCFPWFFLLFCLVCCFFLCFSLFGRKNEKQTQNSLNISFIRIFCAELLSKEKTTTTNANAPSHTSTIRLAHTCTVQISWGNNNKRWLLLFKHGCFFSLCSSLQKPRDNCYVSTAFGEIIL